MNADRFMLLLLPAAPRTYGRSAATRAALLLPAALRTYGRSAATRAALLLPAALRTYGRSAATRAALLLPSALRTYGQSSANESSCYRPPRKSWMYLSSLAVISSGVPKNVIFLLLSSATLLAIRNTERMSCDTTTL